MNKLSQDKLYSLEEYAKIRADFRARVMAHKKNRQLPLGANAIRRDLGSATNVSHSFCFIVPRS